MDKPKVLSGQVLVDKGVTKLDASLPEIGLKDVTPNGSWLEQKQVQSALEARKHLIEVERIEKFGTLSHALWRDDLNLAEVTQKVGGHWQYFGHNVGKTLFLKPEEALFMMEMNCLLLKHNDIKISLQKAYSLLLTETKLTQYKVYASLSRLGYKVFRHKIPTTNKENVSNNNINSINNSDNLGDKLTVNTTISQNIPDPPLTDSSVEIIDSKTNEDVCLTLPTANKECSVDESNKNTISIKKENIENTEHKDEHKVLCKMEKDDIISNNNINTQNSAVHNAEKNPPDANVIVLDPEQETMGVKSIKIENETITINDKDIKSEIVEEADKTEKANIEVVSSSCAITPKKEKSNEAAAVAQETNTSKQNAKEIEARPLAICNENNSIENVKNEAIVKESEVESNAKEINANQEIIASSSTTVLKKENSKNVHCAISIEVDSVNSDVVMDLDTPKSQDSSINNSKSQKHNTDKSNEHISKRNLIFHNYITKLKRLTNRQIKSIDYKHIEKYFENVPDLFKREVVTINVPDQELIPKNIFVNQSSYVLNLNEIKVKSKRSTSTDAVAYNSSDEVSGNHVRRIRSNSSTEMIQNLQFVNNIRLPTSNIRMPPRPFQFRPFGYWRPPNNLNYVQFNMFFQRPYQFNNMFVQSRIQYQPRPSPFSCTNNTNVNSNANDNNSSRKRMRSAKATQLQSIKNLAVRLKLLIMGGTTHIHNIEALQRLLYAYNNRYKAGLRLTPNFDVVSDETIVDTIDLEEDNNDNDEFMSKRQKVIENDDKFDENLNRLRQLALKLKDLGENVTSTHKRALSKAIKTFNKSYAADIYMNNNYEIIDKRHIVLASDSETECVLEEPKKQPKKKKLRNPFNILKRRSEKMSDTNGASGPSTSKKHKSSISENNDAESDTNSVELVDNSKMNIRNIFGDNWLPKDDDFGKAEVVPKSVTNSRFMDSIKDDYLFDDMKNQFNLFSNWLEVKIAFLQHMEETARDIAFQNEHIQKIMSERELINNTGIKPLVDAELASSDMATILEHLRIIKNNREMGAETNLKIDFDVYNRDVQNFRKTSPPKPHFRVICLDEASAFPSIADVKALYSKYDDSVSTVFAVVGISSISYLQMNPLDLPVYVTNDNVDVY